MPLLAEVKRPMRTRITIIHVIFPLVIGSLIYIFFRPTSLRVFKWIDFVGIRNGIESLRSYFSPIDKYIPIWVRFSLPDSLWVYSFTSSMLIVWHDEIKIGKYLLLVPLFLGCLLELAQSVKVFPGTFDIMDLFLNVTGFILSIVLLKPTYNEKEKSNTSFKHYNNC